MPETDEITLSLPQEREFHRVAHLVLGGLAVRLELTIETLEDLQLALATILDEAEPGGEVTVAMTLRDGLLETSVGPLADGAHLSPGADAEDRLSPGRILRTLVDEVHVDGNYVRVLKRLS
jgi:hypothetical protein